MPVELSTIPLSGPLTIKLAEIPVSNSIDILDPFFGYRGKKDKRLLVGTGTGNPNQVINLQMKNIPRDFLKDTSPPYLTQLDNSTVEVYVGSEKWTHVNLAVTSGTTKGYELDYTNGVLKFGDDSNYDAPGAGDEISVRFLAERLFPTGTLLHLSNLNFPTTLSELVVKRYEEPLFSGGIVLAPNSTEFSLGKENIDATSVTFSDTAVFSTSKDSRAELTGAGHYFLDTDTGLLYSYTATGAGGAIVSFSYTPVRVLLTDTEFSLTSNSQISVSSSAWLTRKYEDFSLLSGKRTIGLPTLAVVPGTLKLSDTGLREVTSSQLISVVQTIETIVLSGTSTIRTFDLSVLPTSDTRFKPMFSETSLFLLEDPALDTDGDWSITSGVLSLRVGSLDASDPGEITYFYDNSLAGLDSTYSVNYDRGEIYFHDLSPSGITASWEYTDYRAEYHIAREVTNFTVSPVNRLITISSSEISEVLRYPRDVSGPINRTYQVSYEVRSSL